VDGRKSTAVVSTRFFLGLMFLDGAFVRSGVSFAVVGLVVGFGIVVGRVGLIAGVDVPVTVGEEFVVVIVVVGPSLLLISIMSTSRRTTIAAILIVASATMTLIRARLPIVMDDALVLDGGGRSWPFRLALLIGDRDRILGWWGGWFLRLVDREGGDRGTGTGDVGDEGGLICIDRVLIRNGACLDILFSLGLSGSLGLWRDFDIRDTFTLFGLL
jgi:hypothetical protein